ncbi:MAG: cyclic nucleotide-binding domain-containing protein [Nitrospinae bacterium]|nr:cyclic nucleotide-binding domain-containing protein [Nitrospinota bacterium]
MSTPVKLKPDDSKIFYPKDYAKNTMIFKEGTIGSNAFLIMSGKVEISKIVQGRKIVLAVIGPGEIFGEMAIICEKEGGAERTATAVALDFTQVVPITKEQIKSGLAKTPTMISSIFHSLMDRLKKTTERLSSYFDSGNLFYGICHVLDMLYRLDQKHKAKMEGLQQEKQARLKYPYKVFVKRAAEIFSVSMDDVEKTMEMLKSAKLISLALDKENNKYIVVKDKEFLENARAFHDQWKKSIYLSSKPAVFFDVKDLARQIGVESRKIVEKINSGDFPEYFYYFPKEEVIKWANEVGPEFFEATASAKKKADMGEIARQFEDILKIFY